MPIKTRGCLSEAGPTGWANSLIAPQSHVDTPFQNGRAEKKTLIVRALLAATANERDVKLTDRKRERN